jgi:uncharacterized protein with FMN-binding domain
MSEAGEEVVEGKKKMGRAAKIILWAVAVILIIAVIGGIAAGVYIWRYRKASANLVINDFDLSGIPDGTYEGSYKLFHDAATVSVTVKDHQIVKIDVLKKPPEVNNRNQVARVVDRVIDNQSLKVDTVTSSTVSQKVTLKAIEEALSKSSQ